MSEKSEFDEDIKDIFDKDAFLAELEVLDEEEARLISDIEQDEKALRQAMLESPQQTKEILLMVWKKYFI